MKLYDLLYIELGQRVAVWWAIETMRRINNGLKVEPLV